MATENKKQVLVAMEGDISNVEKLIKLAKECGFKTLFAAMPRDLKRAEAELAEILALASVDGEMRERLAADYWRLRRVLWLSPPYVGAVRAAGVRLERRRRPSVLSLAAAISVAGIQPTATYSPSLL